MREIDANKVNKSGANEPSKPIEKLSLTRRAMLQALGVIAVGLSFLGIKPAEASPRALAKAQGTRIVALDAASPADGNGAYCGSG